jgi:hypothetical protein
MSDVRDQESAGKGPLDNFNTVLAICTILFGIAIIVLTPYQVDERPMLLGMGTSGLDPATFPMMIGVGFILVGILYLIQSRTLHERNLFRDLDRDAWINVGMTLLIGVGYVLILVPLGFVVASALSVGTLSVFYGARNWLSIAFVAIGVPVILFEVFTRVLLVSLPGLPSF